MKKTPGTKYRQIPFGNILTSILLSGILIFAGVVVCVSLSTYDQKQHDIEEYTHSRMKSLILDLEVKMVSTESVLNDKSHHMDLTMNDTLTIYHNLKKFVQDNNFIVNTCLEVWNEGVSEELDTTSDVYYVGRDEMGKIYSDHQVVYDEEVYEDEMIVFNKANETSKPCWSQPYLDKYLSRAYVVTCYKKCDVPGAMLAADVKLTTLLQNIDSMQFYNNSKMYLVSSRGDIYSLIDGGISKTDKIDFNPDRQIKFSAHYRHLNIDIINIVPKDEIYSIVWRGIFIVFLICIVGLTIIALLVRRSFRAAQKRLAITIDKSNQEEMALKKIEDELVIAAHIQKQMLTRPDAGVHLVPGEGFPVDIMSKIIPAREVGGDLYEYRMEGHNLVFCVGDVSGKGIPASVIMAKCCTLFHAYVSYTDDPNPADMLRYLNAQLCRGNETAMFVTMWVGVLDMRNGTLHYSSAGHSSPVVLPDREGELNGRMLTKPNFLPVCKGMPLGLFDDAVYKNVSYRLYANDSIVLYTDGITEAEDSEHCLYGDERLLATCRSVASRCPAVMCDTILQSIRRHAQDYIQSDDITLLCLTYAGHYAQLQSINDVEVIHTLTNELDASYRAALAIEELAVNAFTYGHATFVSIAFEPSNNHYTIIDDGTAFDPTTYTPQTSSADSRPTTPDLLPIGGRGIALVRSVCSKFTYQRLQNDYNKTIIEIKEEVPS